MLLLLFEENGNLFSSFTHFDFSLRAEYFEFDNVEKSNIRILRLSSWTLRSFKLLLLCKFTKNHLFLDYRAV